MSKARISILGLENFGIPCRPHAPWTRYKLTAGLVFGIIKIEEKHLVRGMDGWMTWLAKRCPSHRDITPSPENLEEIGVIDFERAAFVDPFVAIVPVFYEPTPILVENVGLIEEVAPAPKKKAASVLKLAAADKGKGKEVDAPKKEHVPLIRSKGIMIGSPIVPWKLEFGNDDYNSFPGGVPRTERTEEEELALALKASMVIALEEQAARATTVLFEDFPGSFTNP